MIRQRPNLRRLSRSMRLPLAAVATVLLHSCGDVPVEPPIDERRLVRDVRTDCPDAEPLVQGINEGFTSAGQTRRLRVELPDPDRFPGPNPILINFTGTGATIERQINQRGLDVYLDEGFIFVLLGANGNGTIWPWWDALRRPGEEPLPNPDLEFFDDAVDCLAASVSIDKDRVYVSGGSAGGAMVNYVLQRRSQLLAGGDIRSGMFEFTSPSDVDELDPMAVIVTWGGDNDRFSGSVNGATVEEVDFDYQGQLSSMFWESEPGAQVHCRGHNVGHTFIRDTHVLIRDFLLAHPKGTAVDSSWTLPALAEDAPVTCSPEAFDGADIDETYGPVECGDEDSGECSSFCQTVGDCVVENEAISGILSPQLSVIGFDGPGNRECGGCVSACNEDRAGSTVDDEVLSCVAEHMAGPMCGPGAVGAMPFINAVNDCCEGRAESRICQRMCGTLSQSSVVSPFFPTCAAFAMTEDEE